jgi:CDP-diacylglycerol--glycerol-3-phosphate 3-phosphatidyltransferase
MSPVFLVVYLYHDWMEIPFEVLPYVLLAIVAFCEITDIFDGLIARRRNKVTHLGKVLDPMADSIFRLSVLFAFTQGVVALPLLLILVFFIRDSIVSTLRTLCALRGMALGARLSGKIKAIVQGSVAILILIAMIPFTQGTLSLQTFRSIALYAVSIAAVYTVASACEYIRANWDYIIRSLREKEAGS